MSGLQHTTTSKASIKRKYSEFKQGVSKKDDLPVEKEETPQDVAGRIMEMFKFDHSKECWRCRILSLACQPDPYNDRNCRNCSRYLERDDDESRWEFGCMQDEMDKIVAREIPNLPGLGSEEWFMPATSGIWLRFRMSYKHPDHRWRDLDEFTNKKDTTLERVDAIIAFIQQYHADRRYCWPTCDHPIIEDILRACVNIQESILENGRQSWNPLKESNTVIATALQAYGLAYNLSYVSMYMAHPSKEDFEESYWLRPEIITDVDERDEDVTIEGCRAEDASQVDKKDGSKLRMLVSHLFRVTQNMVLKPKGKELPIILCVLCILKLIQECLEPSQPFLQDTFCTEEYGVAWENLCELYHMTGRNYHPIGIHWHRSLYREVVGQENTSSVAYFEELHKIWITNKFDRSCSHMPFPERLACFATGDDQSMPWQRKSSSPEQNIVPLDWSFSTPLEEHPGEDQ